MALACSLYVYEYGRANPDFVSDFDQIWAAARGLWHGKNPYDVVGPRGEFVWKWPFYYPMPAVVLMAPLGLLPVLAARTVFSALSAGLLAWGVTRDGWHRLPVFLSVSFLVTMELSQWSALFAAAYFIPAVAAVGVAKPNLGIALGASTDSGRTLVMLVVAGVVLVVVSTFLQPDWLQSWIRNVREAPHFRAPLVRPFGFLLLLAGLKWRRADARWLLALSVVPLPPSFYDQLLLGVVCLTSREALIFASSTVALFFYVGFNTPQPDYLSWGRVVGNGTLWLCYLPTLVMVLRRPNEGELPTWMTIPLRMRHGRRGTGV